MTRKPGDKGPMGEDAHPDEAADTSVEGAAGSKKAGGSKEDLDEELDESFPASDAPSDTQGTRTK